MNNASARSLGRVRALLEWASELLNKKWSGWTVTPETVMTTRQCSFVQLIWGNFKSLSTGSELQWGNYASLEIHLIQAVSPRKKISFCFLFFRFWIFCPEILLPCWQKMGGKQFDRFLTPKVTFLQAIWGLALLAFFAQICLSPIIGKNGLKLAMSLVRNLHTDSHTRAGGLVF